MKQILLFLFVLNIQSLNSWAQSTTFINSKLDLHEKDQHSAVPVGIADMNGDGLDDIVTLDDGHILNIQYQTPSADRAFIRYEVSRSVDVAEQNDICIADFNNDGLNDIFTIGSYDKGKVYYATKGSYAFTQKIISNLSFFSQGASSGDFNQDGWVDVIILNDNAANFTLINDRNGNLVKQDLFNFITDPPSDNSGNYGSVYTDFDMDGDLDLYIAKCRQGVNDPTDPRRINILFENDGLGNYTQNADQYGLAIGHQTWTADFGDVDNDGDQDCFMTQHDVISELYENINNESFVNITPTTGLEIGGIPLQGMFCDFDNDGYQDILVAGDRVYFYHNNGDKTFTEESPFAPVIFGSFSLGDLNHDGFMDVYASRVIPFNNPDPSRPDVLFLNQPNDNHFLGLQLSDTEENHSAIGAMALLYGPWGVQVKEVRGGEQYGVSNTHTLIFGLGDATTYDSLVVRWPDGSKERYNDLNADRYYSLQKEICYEPVVSVYEDLRVLCNGSGTEIAFGDFSIEPVWNTGDTAHSIIVTSPGLYYPVVTNIEGCRSAILPVEVTTDPDSINPVLIFEGLTTRCFQDEALVSVSSGQNYTWSNGDTTQTISIHESGDYYVLVEGFCNDLYSDTLTLSFLHPEEPITAGDTLRPGETATLIAVGDSIIWFDDIYGTNIIGTGSELVLDGLTDTTIVYAANLNPIPGQDYYVGPVTQKGNTKYNANFINGGLLFEVYEPIILEQFTVYTDSIGKRIIEIFDEANFFFEKEVDLVAGINIVNLNVALPAGIYTVSTNTDQNMEEFGVTSPYLWRSSESVLFPYDVPTVLSITTSTYGAEFYYYFYDWKIKTQDKYCLSDLVPVAALVGFPVGLEQIRSYHTLSLVPNPATDEIRLNLESNVPSRIEITSTDGRIMGVGKHQVNGNAITIDISSFPSGLYLVRAIQDGKGYIGRVVKL